MYLFQELWDIIISMFWDGDEEAGRIISVLVVESEN
jgi:hypothetical protein